jgi:hypothetical protein
MLQWLYRCVASVCFKRFNYFKRMLQVFLSGCYIYCSGYTRMLQVCFLNVSTVLSRCCICCSDYIFRLQVYVLNVSSVSDVYDNCFIWMLLYVEVVIHNYCKLIF